MYLVWVGNVLISIGIAAFLCIVGKHDNSTETRDSQQNDNTNYIQENSPVEKNEWATTSEN